MAVLEPDLDDGGYTVTVPALPGCITQGESLFEALAMARDAISCWIASAVKHGEPVPEEVRHPRAIIITVAA
jgi:predicted RNase H-like HicB family nuclease